VDDMGPALGKDFVLERSHAHTNSGLAAEPAVVAGTTEASECVCLGS
jgi:hypothetical protein